MEHACHNCGASVEEGTPFCPQCSAPQIRVPDAENAPATPPVPPGTPEDAQPPARRVLTQAQPSKAVVWQQALRAAAMAGVVIAIGSTFPILNLMFWIIAGGILAVALYLRRVPAAVLTPGAGARIGLVGGIFEFLIVAFAGALQLLAARGSGRLRDAMRQVMEQAAARNAGDPNTQRVMEWMTSPQGIALMVTVLAAVMLVAFLGFSALGGALGVKLFGKRQ